MRLFSFLKRYPFLAGSCLGIAALTDWLTYRQTPGWVLAAIILSLAAIIVVRSPQALGTTPPRVYLGLIVLMAFATVEEPTLISLSLAAIFLGNLAMTLRNQRNHGLARWSIRWIELFATLLLRPIFDFLTATKWFSKHPSAKPRIIKTTLSWSIPLLAGTVFVVLFAAGNPIIANWFSELGTNIRTVLRWLPDIINSERIGLWALAILSTYALQRYRPFVRFTTPIRKPPIVKTANPQPIIRCLLVFNVIFAVQTLLDLIYLYGGTQLPAGMTYAAYAHRSAYPLIATALLAGLFTMIAFRNDSPAQKSRIACRLLYVWIAQNIFLLFSTIFRLTLYVQSYGLSRWRVATMLWIAIVAIGFLWLIWKINTHRSNQWLVSVNLRTLTAALILCAFTDINAIIADFNVRHSRELGGQSIDLDLAYLADLGPSALPAMIAALPHMQGQRQFALEQQIFQTTAKLTQQLGQWREWTWRDHRTLHMLHIK